MLSLTLALDGTVWSVLCSGHFTPGKETQYPLYRRLVGSQGWSKWVLTISLTLRFDLWIIQPIVSWYTTYTIQAYIIDQVSEVIIYIYIYYSR